MNSIDAAKVRAEHWGSRYVAEQLSKYIPHISTVLFVLGIYSVICVSNQQAGQEIQQDSTWRLWRTSTGSVPQTG